MKYTILASAALTVLTAAMALAAETEKKEAVAQTKPPAELRTEQTGVLRHYMTSAPTPYEAADSASSPGDEKAAQGTWQPAESSER